MPSSPSRQARLAQLIARPFAHRGLHGAGRIENSRAAFAAAIDAGHGIELDVQASRDGRPMVFHDATLNRLATANGKLADRDAAEMSVIGLRGSDETIPTLGEVLALVAGRVPLLIEIKTPRRRAGALAGAVEDALRNYRGDAGIMSFNPEVGRWLRRHAPDRLRGLVVTERRRRWRGLARRWVAWWRATPDFLAYDIGDLPSPFAAARRAAGLLILTWTCRTAEERGRGAAHADQIIFEEAP